MIEIVFDGAQVFAVKSMIIQQTSSWMLSLPVKGQETVMKVTVDFKVCICTCFRACATLLMTPLQCTIRHFALITVNLTFFGIDGQTKSIGKVDLVEYYENSDQFKSIQGKLEPIVDSAVMGSRRNGKTPSYATGFFWQVNLLSVRSVE